MENSDNNEVDKDAVKAFLEKNGINTSDSERITQAAKPEEDTPVVQEEPPMEEEKKEDEGPLIPPDVQEKLAAIEASSPKPDEEEHENARLTPDKTFSVNSREKANHVFVPVLDIDVPITDEDKDTYFKSMLFDTAIELPITSMQGKVVITCRALNVYENDLVYVALERAMKDHKLPPTAWEGLCQQYRMVMQVVRFNGTLLDYTHFDTPGNTNEDAGKLLEAAKSIYSMSMAKYNLYLRSLHVFQYKVNKLNEAIYNQGFWNPVGIG